MSKSAFTLKNQLLEECHAMARYALTSGMQIPGKLVTGYEDIVNKEGSDFQDIKRLNAIHAGLTKVVAPAVPRTILLLDREAKKKGIIAKLGPVPLIRQLTFVAIASMVCLIVISLSPNVNATSINNGVFASSGIVLLLNMLFLLSASAIGASFYSLYQANQYVTKGIYDPKYSSTYLTKFVLGLIAGLMLAELIPVELDTNGAISQAFVKPVLAIIGGFSATAVYKLLNRLVGALEAFVGGQTKEKSEAQIEIATGKMELQNQQEKLALAARLNAVLTKAESSGKIEEVKDAIREISTELMPEEIEILPASKS